MDSGKPRLESLLMVFVEIDRVRTEGVGICGDCVFYEAPRRGGWRHCSLGMDPLNQHDSCEEWETRAGQNQLPLGLGKNQGSR